MSGGPPTLDPAGLYEKTRHGPNGEPAELMTNSPSLLNNADICLARAVYGKTRPYTSGEAALCGNGYHAGLEEYYLWRKDFEETTDLREDDWPAPPAWLVERCYIAAKAEIFARVRDIEQDFVWDTSFDETVTRAQQMIHAYFAGGHYWPADYRILGVEIGFLVPSIVDGWVDKGFMDLVVYQEGTGHTILDDHKSAGKKWKKNKESPRTNNQPAMYDIAWEAATGVKPDAFAFSVMTYAGEFERRLVYVQEHDRNLVRAKQRTDLPLIEQGIKNGLQLPGNTSSFLCSERWCDHWLVCPFGAPRN